MTRRVLVGASLAVALSGFARPAAAQARMQVWLPGFSSPVSLDTVAVRNDVAAQRGALFAAAASVLGKAGIPLMVRDSLAGRVGNPALELRRRLGDTPLSRYVSCGNGFSGAHADQWRVTMAVVAFVDPADAGARLGIAVAAGAIDPEGATKDPVACGSTGLLERQLTTRILAQVAGIGGAATPR